MKAMIIGEDEAIISRAKYSLENNGYDTIIYRWLLKALDNIEEILPHLVLINVRDYPRHWKTFVQYTSTLNVKFRPKIVLFIDRSFNLEEQKKAQALGINAVFPIECSDEDFDAVINRIR